MRIEGIRLYSIDYGYNLCESMDTRRSYSIYTHILQYAYLFMFYTYVPSCGIKLYSFNFVQNNMQNQWLINYKWTNVHYTLHNDLFQEKK